MRIKSIHLALALSLVSSIASAEQWTYRGTLNEGGLPANGSYDIRFSLLSENQNASIAGPMTLYDVAVENGQFAVDVDFGIDLANAPVMRLKTEVQQGGSGFAALGQPTYFDAKAALGSMCWDTTGNAGTHPSVNFLGTTDAQPFVLRTQNYQSLRIEPSAELFGSRPITANIIAGSSANSVTAGVRGATISGGGTFATDPIMPSARANEVFDAYGTVGGGASNRSGSDDVDALNHTFATVGGGFSNSASGVYSIIGGGRGNVALGLGSTVAGGYYNCAGGDYSWAGGLRAAARPGEGAEPLYCLGVPRSGDADGDEGTFIWADSQSSTFNSSGSNQFLVRAAGGIGLNTNDIPPGIEMSVRTLGSSGNVDIYLRPGLHKRGINMAMLPGNGDAQFRIAQYDGTTFTDRLLLRSNGDFEVTAQAFKPGGGSWAVSSDARLKTDVTPLSGALDRLLALRSVEYTYINPDPAKRPAGRQIGFIAQEVAEVFPAWVSTDDEGYLAVAPQGFEALTVQSLRELQAQNTALKASLEAVSAQNAAFEDRLRALESGR